MEICPHIIQDFIAFIQGFSISVVGTREFIFCFIPLFSLDFFLQLWQKLPSYHYYEHVKISKEKSLQMHVPLYSLHCSINKSILEAESFHCAHLAVLSAIGASAVSTCHPYYSPKHLQTIIKKMENYIT